MIISTALQRKKTLHWLLKHAESRNNDITLLKCTSSYPAPVEDANKIMIPDLANRLGVKARLSDHTMGSVSPIIATVLGAKVIEKHFIIDRSIGGPDASFSMNEHEFSEMVKAVRDAEKAIGTIDYSLNEKTIKNRVFARSLYVVRILKKAKCLLRKM